MSTPDPALEMTGIAAVILAAGQSRRFGSPKLLFRIGDRSLIARSADLAREAGCRPTVAVVGSSAGPVAAELRGAEVDLVVNSGWKEGMASSIRTGIARVREIAPEAAAAILILADQPHVSREILRSLASRLRRGPESAVACRYEGILGAPAIFSSMLFGRLAALTGDVGARSLLRSGSFEVAAIDFPQGALDLDSPPPGAG